MSLFQSKTRIKKHGIMHDGPVDGSRCDSCDAACCRGFPSVKLTVDEYDVLEKLGAQRITFTLDGTFYLLIENGCEFLVDNRCAIYAHRPGICRRFACSDNR